MEESEPGAGVHEGGCASGRDRAEDDHPPLIFLYLRVWSHDEDGQLTFRSGVLRAAASRMLPRSRRRTLLRAAVDLFRRRGDERTTLALLDQLVELLADGPERQRLDAERHALRARLPDEPAAR